MLTPEQRRLGAEALQAGRYERVATLPKTDLHAHGLLSASSQALRLHAGARGEPPKHFDGVPGFLRWVGANVPRPSSADAYHALLRSAFDRMAGENVVYAELTFPIDEAKALGLDATDWAALVLDAGSACPTLRVAPGIAIERSLSTWRAGRLVRRIAKSDAFAFIDFCGHESARDLAEYRKVADLARSLGLEVKAHLGETGEANDVRDGVLALELDAVQHGNAAGSDPSVVEFLAKRGTVLNLCPASNVALGLVPSIEEHPIGRLLRGGVTVTLNTDDFGVFRATLTDQVVALHASGNLSADELMQILDNGLRQVPPSLPG